MFFSLVLIAFATSQHNGWHASVHRVDLDDCNEIKSLMTQTFFCGQHNLVCERQEGFKILGPRAQFQGQFKQNPNVEAHGDWVKYVNDRNLKITTPTPSQCDILRLSAIIGKPWSKIVSPLGDTIEPLGDTNMHRVAILVGEQHSHRIIVGNIVMSPGFLPVEEGRTVIKTKWELLTELYIVIDGTTVDLSIVVDDPSNFFSPNMMGFLHNRKEERVSVTGGTTIIAAEPFFFAESLTEGFIESVTAKCTDDIQGGAMILEEILRPGEQGQYVASCTSGYRAPKFTMRKATSKMSAIAVCVPTEALDGGDVKPYSEVLVDYPTAVQVCAQRSMSIPTLSQVRSTAFCNKIYPFGDFYYMWVKKDSDVEEPVHIETVDDISPHAQTFEDDVDQDDLIVDVNARTAINMNNSLDGLKWISGVFPQMTNSNQPWGIIAEYTYPKECHVLETKIEYKPMLMNSETIEGVSRWIVSRRNGIWSYGEFYAGQNCPWCNAIVSAPVKRPNGTLRFAQRWNRQDVIPNAPSHRVSFYGFGEPNHISGETIINPGAAPRSIHINGDPRYPKFYAVQRSFLAVKTLSQCVFKLVSSMFVRSLTIWGVGANVHENNFRFKWVVNRKFSSLSSYKEHIADTTNLRTLTLVPGRYYYAEWQMLEPQYDWQPNVNFKQTTLLWDCGEGLQVVPRLNFFSVGNTEQQIISDQVHIDVVSTAEFRISLSTPPPAEGATVVCTGPSSLVITPQVLPFSTQDWTEMRIVTVFSGVKYFSNPINPDVLITCTSADLNTLSISVTLGLNNPQHFQVSPSGYFANWYSSSTNQQWRVRDFQLTPDQNGGCVYTLLHFDHEKFTFFIQTKHDSAEVYDIKISPLTGVAFAYGPYVFAAYSSRISDGWNVYRLSETAPGGPKISRMSLDDPINPGKLTVEFPCGSICQVIPHGDHFMHLSCVLPGSFSPESIDSSQFSSCVTTGNSFFSHPTAVTSSLIKKEAVPVWPAGTTYNDQVFATVVPPEPMNGKSLNFPEDDQKMSADEVSAFKAWSVSLKSGIDLSRHWNEIDSKCPLMSDKVASALRPFLSSTVSGWISEINLPEYITSLLQRCQADFFMQKFFSCLGPYQFNEDDAVQSLRSIVYYFVSMSRKVSDNIEMAGRGLILLADNGMPGHLCSRRGHLVGSPPVCACIEGSGNVYPNCPDTIDCPPATQFQLDMMASLADPSKGTNFCRAEKSIVIVPSLGVSINCFRGFCYYWSGPNVRNGLKYEMCVTPYCVTGYQRPDAATIVWYGLTECGETVRSNNNGDTWSISGDPFPTDAPEEYKAIPVMARKVRIPMSDGEYYEVDASSIVRSDVSSGKMVTVSMKWWCECIDPDIWNLLLI